MSVSLDPGFRMPGLWTKLGAPQPTASVAWRTSGVDHPWAMPAEGADRDPGARPLVAPYQRLDCESSFPCRAKACRTVAEMAETSTLSTCSPVAEPDDHAWGTASHCPG